MSVQTCAATVMGVVGVGGLVVRGGGGGGGDECTNVWSNSNGCGGEGDILENCPAAKRV